MPSEHETRSCLEKKTFKTEYEAQRFAHGINRINFRRGHSTPIKAYLCDFEDHYHVGHRSKEHSTTGRKIYDKLSNGDSMPSLWPSNSPSESEWPS